MTLFPFITVLGKIKSRRGNEGNSSTVDSLSSSIGFQSWCCCFLQALVVLDQRPFLRELLVKASRLNGPRKLLKSLEASLAKPKCHLKCDLKMVRNRSKGPPLKALIFSNDSPFKKFKKMAKLRFNFKTKIFVVLQTQKC